MFNLVLDMPMNMSLEINQIILYIPKTDITRTIIDFKLVKWYAKSFLSVLDQYQTAQRRP